MLINRIVLAVVMGIIVTLACILVGGILASLDIGLALVVGGFLKTYGAALGVLSALWYFFAGRL